MTNWTKLGWLCAAGALGTLARFGLSGLVQSLHQISFPIGTFVVNALGCLLFGVIWSLAEERLLISGDARQVILIGFMGAFTTFSTFAFETGAMLRDSEWLMASANILGQNVIGIALLFLGLALGRQF